jgi:2-oxoglutarate dehydrogenase E2 component (dihydrolipoamide succinyltransferase)
VCDINKLLNL